MSDRVYLHYTQAELDRNFDQRGWAKNALEVIARYEGLSHATRARLERRANVAYGPSPDEVLDIFVADRAPAPVQIFVHGGAWRNFTKDDYAFPASSYVPAGIHTVVINFANLPQVRLPEMTAQVARAVEWTYRNAASFGGDPERIFLSAHSSGSHLGALALEVDWAARGLPRNIVKAATLVSGPYDLEPVLLSARSAYVKLSPEEARDLSPILHAKQMTCPVVLVYSDHDTDEFQRQSREFAAALERAGRLERLLVVSGLNHFELMETFVDPESVLVRAILAQMREHGAPLARR